MPILSHMTKHDPTLDTLFQALADPTRRAMISRLMEGPATVSDLAEPTGMALPTVLAHIGKLESGGLIATTKQGRTRICTANVEAFETATTWLDQQRKIWEGRLDRLEAFLETEANQSD